MAKQYAGFLVRRWRLAGGEERIVVEHIPTGARLGATTMEEAVAWIRAWDGVVPGEPPAAAGHERPAPDSAREIGRGARGTS